MKGASLGRSDNSIGTTGGDWVAGRSRAGVTTAGAILAAGAARFAGAGSTAGAGSFCRAALGNRIAGNRKCGRGIRQAEFGLAAGSEVQ